LPSLSPEGIVIILFSRSFSNSSSIWMASLFSGFSENLLSSSSSISIGNGVESATFSSGVSGKAHSAHSSASILFRSCFIFRLNSKEVSFLHSGFWHLFSSIAFVTGAAKML